MTKRMRVVYVGWPPHPEERPRKLPLPAIVVGLLGAVLLFLGGVMGFLWVLPALLSLL